MNLKSHANITNNTTRILVPPQWSQWFSGFSYNLGNIVFSSGDSKTWLRIKIALMTTLRRADQGRPKILTCHSTIDNFQWVPRKHQALKIRKFSIMSLNIIKENWSKSWELMTARSKWKNSIIKTSFQKIIKAMKVNRLADFPKSSSILKTKCTTLTKMKFLNLTKTLTLNSPISLQMITNTKVTT